VERQLRGARGTKAEKLAATLRRLYEDDTQAFGRIQSINEQAATETARRADKARDAAKRAREKRQDALRDMVRDAVGDRNLGVSGGLTFEQVRLATLHGDQAANQARQFRQLGLTGTGADRVPGAGALLRTLGTLEQNIKGTPLDKPKLQSRLAAFRRVLTGEFGKAREDVRRTIKGMFDDIDQQLKERGSGSGFKKLRPEKLAQVLGIPTAGLSTLQRRQLFSNLSQLGRGGQLPAGRTAAFAGGGTPIVIHNLHTSAVNVRQLEDDIVKRARGRAYVRRGAK
jgi:hypothetical protein